MFTEIQNTIDKLKDILKEQKEDIKNIIEKNKLENIDYEHNLNKYIELSKIDKDIELDIFQKKQKKILLKEQIEYSKNVINEYHKKNYNKLIMKNLENYLSL